MPSLYIEVSDLLWRLRLGQELDGITRTTLLCLEGLVEHCRYAQIKLLAFDAVSRTYRENDISHLSAPANGRIAYRRDDFVQYLASLRLIPFWRLSSVKTGDLILYSGNWWWRPRSFQALEKTSRETGSCLCVFIHDLIPLVHPDYVYPSTVSQFNSGINGVCASSSAFLVNSNATKKDLVHLLGEKQLEHKTVFVMPLPHEFSPVKVARPYLLTLVYSCISRRNAMKVIAQLESQLQPDRFVLMVGAIDKRKNIVLMLEAWEIVLDELEGPKPLLVLAGRWGHGAEEIKSRIQRSEKLAASVVVINNATDDLLVSLYERCMFTVYLSLCEGWGLPVGESLWFGKHVLTSNLSSLPEAGGTIAHYVNPTDRQQVAESVLQLIRSISLGSLTPIEREALRTRTDFGKSLAGVLQGVMGSAPVS